MMNDPLSLHDADQALQFISADCSRDDWFRIAAALKDEYGAAGFDAFDAWSQTGSSYNKQACKDTFRSAKAGHVRIGSLIKMAVDGGWKRAQRELSAEDKKRLAAERKKAAAERAKRQAEEDALAARLHESVGKLCSEFWHGSTSGAGLSQHPYLVRKGVAGDGCSLATTSCYFAINVTTGDADRLVSSFGTKAERDAAGIHLFRIKKGDLLMPLRDPAGNILALQRIDADGTKMLPKGARKQGCGLLLGEAQADQPLGFAEGYATAATVHQVMGWPVVVCVDAGNLLAVAQSLAHLPRSATVWLADNDAPNEKTGKQAGQQAAQACQKALGGIIALPQFPHLEKAHEQ